MCVYIYIYREREREREICMYVCIYMCVYIYTYVHTYTQDERDEQERFEPMAGAGSQSARGLCIL